MLVKVYLLYCIINCEDIKVTQLQVLNKILDTKDASIITLNGLTEDFFSEYKDEFLFIKEHLDKYNQVPDKNSFLIKFPNSPENIILAIAANKRYLAESFNKVKSLVEQGKTEDALSVFKQAYDGLKTGVSLNAIDILTDTSRYDDYANRINSFDKYYVKTGFKELDRVIGGWDREEELATIVARTNYGKSWILLKCATAALEQGLRVGLYSGEMTPRKVGYRFDTLVGHISNGGLNHGNGDIQVQYKRYIEDLPTKFTGSFKILHPTMINGPAGVSALRAFIEKENLDILFIDQHSLLEDDRKAKTPVERASNISKDLKNLQVMTRIPIIAVSQQNRTTSENGVDTTQIAQSDRIGQDSTVILFLEKKDKELTMTLVKSRDSENGKKLKYLVDFNSGYFTYLPDENEQTDQEDVQQLENRYTRNISEDEQEGNVF